MLLLIALFGLLIPNGIFVYWLLNEFHTMSDITGNRLALSFIIEAFAVMLLMAYYFAVNPPGRIKWYWFIVLSLIGGIGFSIPFYWWLNGRGLSITGDETAPAET
jgi:hypothetical protein